VTNKKPYAFSGKRTLPQFVIPVVLVLLFALVGGYALVSSHAATIGYTQVLNYQARSQTVGVTDIQAQVNSIGSQTVSDISPGAQLDYQVGGKVAISQECYFVEVLPLKGGGTTATVQFTGQGSAITRQLVYDPNQAGNFQKVCVSSGNGTIQAYNVYNKSPSTGPDVLVFEDVLTI